MFSATVDPTRSRRTAAVLASLSGRFSGSFRLLELGSGPGPLTERILGRWPQARVVALDNDPVLLRVGETALRRFRERSRWVLADMRDPTWPSALPFRRFDAVVSSLTLHWLEKREIRAVYQAVHTLLRPGGVFADGDFIPDPRAERPSTVPARAKVSPRRSEADSTGVGAFKVRWADWWGALANDPSMQTVLQDRRIRLPGPFPPRRTSGPKIPVPLESRVKALRDAGFESPTVAWQERDFRVLVAVR